MYRVQHRYRCCDTGMGIGVCLDIFWVLSVDGCSMGVVTWLSPYGWPVLCPGEYVSAVGGRGMSVSHYGFDQPVFQVLFVFQPYEMLISHSDLE